MTKIITEIQEQLPGNVYPRFLYLIPDSTEGFLEYPYSASFMAQTFARTQSRSDHATLDNSDPVKLIEIQTMFMQLNRGVRFDDDFAQSNGLDGFLRLPLANESVKMPDDVVDALK